MDAELWLDSHLSKKQMVYTYASKPPLPGEEDMLEKYALALGQTVADSKVPSATQPGPPGVVS